MESWPFQLAYHACLRASELCEKARGLGLRIDPRKTDALYIPPPHGKGATKSTMDTSSIRVFGGDQNVVPSHSIKWLGVTLGSRSASEHKFLQEHQPLPQ